MPDNTNTSIYAKQEAFFQSWLSPQGVKFVSPEAEKAYKERVTRIKDAIQLKKKPDRVPVFPIAGFFPAFYSGITPGMPCMSMISCMRPGRGTSWILSRTHTWG